MKKVRLGIIGLGRAGFTMHVSELKNKTDMFEIAAVCDIEADRCENMNKEYGCKTYSKVEDIVLDPDIDVIDVATRSCDHYTHAKTALDAGKIVLLEKPICVNMYELEALKKLNEKYPGKLYIRHNRRFEAMFMQLQNIIDSGKLGNVYYIKRSETQFDRRRDWQTLSQYGGGQLLNWGPHLVDQAIQFCGGDYTRLSSYTTQVAAAGDCEDYVSATFVGVNGRQVQIEISGGTATHQPMYVVYGSRGTLIDNTDGTFTIKYIPDDFVLQPIVALATTPEGAKFLVNPNPEFVEETIKWEENPLDHIWPYLYEAIVNGKEYPISFEQAYKTMKTLCLIKEQNTLS